MDIVGFTVKFISDMLQHLGLVRKSASCFCTAGADPVRVHARPQGLGLVLGQHAI